MGVFRTSAQATPFPHPPLRRNDQSAHRSNRGLIQKTLWSSQHSAQRVTDEEDDPLLWHYKGSTYQNLQLLLTIWVLSPQKRQAVCLVMHVHITNHVPAIEHKEIYVMWKNRTKQHSVQVVRIARLILRCQPAQNSAINCVDEDFRKIPPIALSSATGGVSSIPDSCIAGATSLFRYCSQNLTK